MAEQSPVFAVEGPLGAPLGGLGRNVFGKGALQQLPAELQTLGVCRVCVIGSGTARSIQQLAVVAAALGQLHARTWDGCKQYIYPESLEDAEQALRSAAADCVVAVGGGGPVGYGKILAWRLGIPLACVVTTYSGSECTALQSIIEDGAKKIYTNPAMLATVRIYDTDMTLSLPPRLSVVSGMNGLAHAFSAIYNPASNRYHLMVATEAVRCMSTALRELHALSVDEDPTKIRTAALYAAWLCGVCIAGLGIHHKIAHILGGTFKANHADSHTVALPHSIAYNEAAAPAERNAAASVALGGSRSDSPSVLMHELQKSLGAPTSLHEIGLPGDFGEADLPRLMHEIMEGAVSHPACYEAYSESRILDSLTSMYHGQPPEARPSVGLANAVAEAACGKL
jgi:maleylacetate reductase